MISMERPQAGNNSKACIHDPLPPDVPAQVAAFLDHWQPDLCIWMCGNLHPLLISEAKRRAVPMMLVGFREACMDQPLWRWLPNLARETVGCFDLVSAASAADVRFLHKLGVAQKEFEITPDLQIATPPPAAHVRFDELNEMLAGRAVWLAAQVQQDELGDILEAHRTSIRLTHRLLLILVCASFPVAMRAREKLVKDGWRTCFWDDGDALDESTQIVLVEYGDDMGLWYRAAPVSFLASSLKPGYGGCDPYEAAALGTAVIYGPNVSDHLHSYSRLAAAGAARIVADADGLARALAHLLAIDQAAAMAHAAWQIISEGAEATDRIIEQIQDLLDAELVQSPSDAHA